MVKIVECSGTHFQMGFTQGKETRYMLENAYRVMREFSIRWKVKPRFVPFRLLVELGGIYYGSKLNSLLKLKMKNQHERLKGISKGSGLRESHLQFMQAVEILSGWYDHSKTKHGVTPTLYAQTTGATKGCTSFAVEKQKSKTRKIIAAKNYDFPNEFEDAQIVRKNYPVNKFSSIDFTEAPLAGHHNGMNEHGLVALYTYVSNTEKTFSVPLTILLQEVLENCKNVDEAIKFIEKAPRGNGGNILLADTEKVVVVETSPSSCEVRLPKNGFIVSTNHYITEKMKRFSLPDDYVYPTTIPDRTWHNVLFKENSEIRFDWTLNYLNEHLLVDIADFKKILRSHGSDNKPNINTVCKHTNAASTLGSVIFVPEDRKMFVVKGKPCEKEYTELTL